MTDLMAAQTKFSNGRDQGYTNRNKIDISPKSGSSYDYLIFAQRKEL